MNKILKYLPPTENEILSNLSPSDLLDMIILLEKLYLEPRTTLNLPQNITFGVEIEFEHANMNKLRNLLEVRDITWTLAYDYSLNDGAELDSPVLTDKESSYKQINKVCNTIKECAIAGPASAGHIHIGSHILKDYKSWDNFLKSWITYENIIYRFLYGEYLTPRERILKYAFPIKQLLSADLQKLPPNNNSLKELINTISHERYQGVNFKRVTSYGYEENNTIEFRSPNATLDVTIWQNNINFLTKLLLYASSNNYNSDIITARRTKNNSKNTNIYLYNQIYLEQALELADEIFNNNLDKLYFLRAYLKNYEVASEPLTLAKKYTKT